MVAEVPGIRTAAEQTVQGSDLGGDRLQHVFRQRQGPDLLADGLGETRRGLAGGCREADAQRLAGGYRRCLEQTEQAHHGGGLAGTGTAGDQAEIAAGRQGTGQLLPVGDALAVFRRRLREQRGQARRQVCGQGRLPTQALAQGQGDLQLVPPITTQVETLSAKHQRRGRRLARLGIAWALVDHLHQR